METIFAVERAGDDVILTRRLDSTRDGEAIASEDWRSAMSLSETSTPSVPWTTVALGARADQSFMAPHCFGLDVAEAHPSSLTGGKGRRTGDRYPTRPVHSGLPVLSQCRALEATC